ncbi:MAG: polymer-forming cytoskeletal protein [Proteobacteria bacterium]|nr:polymer-forming cytoskeletal protein [Pseudomonadota bacterium]
MIHTSPVSSGSKDEKVTTILADDLEIQGTIKFKSSLMIKGILDGEIISEGLLIVGPTAKVTATPDIVIEKGSLFNGSCTMKRELVVQTVDAAVTVTTVEEEVVEASTTKNEMAIKVEDEKAEMQEEEAEKDINKKRSGNARRAKGPRGTG